MTMPSSQTKTSEVQEPSNLELLEMLVELKIELSNTGRQNNKCAEEIFMDMSTATQVAGGTGRIFINENLTSYRKDLLRKANDKHKDGLNISAWSTDGKIFTKTSVEGAPVRIYAKEDLENLQYVPQTITCTNWIKKGTTII